MKQKLLTIGIDAPNGELLESWLAQGLLPSIGQVAAEGLICRYEHQKLYRNERCWDAFLNGRESTQSGSVFIPETYAYFNESLQRQESHPPFYANLRDRKICMFDLPAPLLPQIEGIQIVGWGSELNASYQASLPVGVMAEIQKKYGWDPKLEDNIRVKDFRSGEEERSYVLPCIYDRQAVLAFKDKLLAAIERRTNIALDLMGRDDWDLYLMVYPESHTANHVLWHLGEQHPLHAPDAGLSHALLEIYQAIDDGIRRVLTKWPVQQPLLIYTLDHTTRNSMDVPSMVLLPEYLYRWNFPGHRALATGDAGTSLGEPRMDYRQHWKHDVWSLRTDEGDDLLESPDRQEAAGDALSWNSANWYKPLWPIMRAFALPSVGDGYIRLNVQGRESQGRIAADQFHATLLELEKLLRRTVNARTGRPLVTSLVKVRETPFERPDIPPDLIVCWDEASAADTMDSPDLGRIGPIPYFRTGGHVSHGTLVENTCYIRGPGISPESAVRYGRLEDLASTILHLLGEPVPAGVTDRPLFDVLGPDRRRAPFADA